MTRFALLFAACMAAVSIGSPAHATSAVTLEVTAGTGLAPAAPISCAVSVPDGSDGVRVLDAAKASGCIEDYSTSFDPAFGAFLTCIDVAEPPLAPETGPLCAEDKSNEAAYLGTYWGLYFDGGFASSGLDGFSAGSNSKLALSFEGYAFPAV